MNNIRIFGFSDAKFISFIFTLLLCAPHYFKKEKEAVDMSETILKIIQLERKWQDLEQVKTGIDNVKEVEKLAVQIASLLQKDSSLSKEVFSSYLKMLARMLSRMMHYPNELLNYAFKRLAIGLLEKVSYLLERYDQPDSSAIRSFFSIEEMKTIYYSLAFLLERLKIHFLFEPSTRQQAIDADSEHLLEISLDFLTILMKPSKSFLTPADYDLFINASILSIAPQYVLIALQLTNVSAKVSFNVSRVAMKSLKLLEAVVQLIDNNPSFWRQSFPGIFSSFYNFVVRQSSLESLSRSRSRDWSYSSLKLLLTLLLTITTDHLPDHLLYLSNDLKSDSSDKTSSSSASLFRSFVKQVRPSEETAANPVSETVSEKPVLDSQTKTNVKSTNDFSRIEDFSRWRVDFLQKIERSFPLIVRNLVSRISSDQSRLLASLVEQLLSQSKRFLGVRGVAELFCSCLILLRNRDQMLLSDLSLPSFSSPSEESLLREILTAKLTSCFERIITAVPITANLFPSLTSLPPNGSRQDKQGVVDDLRLFVSLAVVLKEDHLSVVLSSSSSLEKYVKVFPLLFSLDLPSSQRTVQIETQRWYYPFYQQRRVSCLALDLPSSRYPWLVGSQLSNGGGSGDGPVLDREMQGLLRTTAVLVTRAAPLLSSGSLEERLRLLSQRFHSLLKRIYSLDSRNTTDREGEREEGEVSSNQELLTRFDFLIAHLHFLQSAVFSLYPAVSVAPFLVDHKDSNSSDTSSMINKKTPLLSCDYCQVQKEQLLRCAKCKTSYYCSRDHQQLHWTLHKLSCKPSKEESRPLPVDPDPLITSTKEHEEVKAMTHFDPLHLFAPLSSPLLSTNTNTNTNNNHISLLVSDLQVTDYRSNNSRREVIIKEVVKICREIIENFLFLSIQSFTTSTSVTSNQRLTGFVLPLYALLVVNTLHLLGDVSRLAIDSNSNSINSHSSNSSSNSSNSVVQSILQEVMYVVMECVSLREDSAVSTAAKTCLTKLALHSYSGYHREEEKEKVVKLLSSEALVSWLLRNHLDMLLNHISSVFRESNLLISLQSSSSSSPSQLAVTNTSNSKKRSSSSSTTSHHNSFLFKYYPNHLTDISFNRASLSLRVIRWSFQVLTAKTALASVRGGESDERPLLLWSKELIEELLATVDHQFPHYLNHGLSSFQLTTIAVLREAVRFFPTLYHQSLPHHSRLSLSSPTTLMIMSFSSFSSDLKSFLIEMTERSSSPTLTISNNSTLTTTTAKSRTSYIASYLLFLQSIDSLTDKPLSEDDQRVSSDLKTLLDPETGHTVPTDNEEESELGEEKKQSPSPSESLLTDLSLSDQILSLLVAVRARLTYFLSNTSSHHLLVKQQCLEVLVMVFLELLELQSNQQRLFEQEIFSFSQVLVELLRDCHSLLRLRLLTSTSTSHSNEKKKTQRLELERRDFQRLSLLVREQHRSEPPPPHSSATITTTTSQSQQSEEEVSFQLLSLLSTVYDFFSVLMTLRRSGRESVTSFLSLRLSEDLLPELSHSLLFFVKQSVTLTSRAEENKLQESQSRHEPAKLALLHFMSHCLDNRDFIRLFAISSNSSQGMKETCDIFKTWIWCLLVFLSGTETKAVRELSLSMLEKLARYENPFLSLVLDTVISTADNNSTQSGDTSHYRWKWRLMSRDASLSHNQRGKTEKERQSALSFFSEDHLDRILDRYCGDSELVDSLRIARKRIISDEEFDSESDFELQHLLHYSQVH